MSSYAVINRDGAVREVTEADYVKAAQFSDKSYKDGGRLVQRTELPNGIVVRTDFNGYQSGNGKWFITQVLHTTDQPDVWTVTLDEALNAHIRAVATESVASNS